MLKRASGGEAGRHFVIVARPVAEKAEKRLSASLSTQYLLARVVSQINLHLSNYLR